MKLDSVTTVAWGGIVRCGSPTCAVGAGTAPTEVAAALVEPGLGQRCKQMGRSQPQS